MSEMRLHVAVAVVSDSENRVLLSRRHPDSHQGGLWEFPGGKVESGESVEQALVRELQEELGITANAYRPLIQIPHDYPEQKVMLDVWKILAYKGQPSGVEGQEVVWVDERDLPNYPMPIANHAIAKALSLPDKYLITPEPGSSESEWELFLKQLEKSIFQGIQLLQFRSRNLAKTQYAELATEVVKICHALDCKVLLNSSGSGFSDIATADGIHLTSQHLMQQEQRVISSDKLLSASCHTEAELEQAHKIGCDFIVLSPVNKTASHPDTTPLGWSGFSQLAAMTAIPVYALGGVSSEQLSLSWDSGAQGVAGISSFWVSEVCGAV